MVLSFKQDLNLYKDWVDWRIGGCKWWMAGYPIFSNSRSNRISGDCNGVRCTVSQDEASILLHGYLIGLNTSVLVILYMYCHWVSSPVYYHWARVCWTPCSQEYLNVGTTTVYKIHNGVKQGAGKVNLMQDCLIKLDKRAPGPSSPIKRPSGNSLGQRRLNG